MAPQSCAVADCMQATVSASASTSTALSSTVPLLSQDPQGVSTSIDSSKRRRCNEDVSSVPKSKKRLRWSTITVHEFGVGLGGSSVPTKGGPSIGLSDAPEFTWTTKVGEMAECSEGIHRFTADERTQLLQDAGVSDGMILRFARETNIILTSRRRTLKEDAEERRRMKKRKHDEMAAAATAVAMHRPCSSFVHRPTLIPPSCV